VSIQSCRVLYLGEFEVDISGGEYSGKLGPFVEALSKQFADMDVFVPRLTGVERYFQGLRSFSTDITTWKSRYALNVGTFRGRTRIIEKYLQKQPQPYDFIIQELSLFTPGTRLEERTYFVMTDNTVAISLQHWPTWAPFRNRREREAWLSAERILYQNAARIFPVSEMVVHSLQHDYGCAPERITPPIGMGANILAKSIDDKNYEPQIVLFVGLDPKVKGLKYLLNAWKVVQAEYPAAELWIVGLGPLPGYHDLPGVKWHGIVRDRNRMRDIYSQATIYAQPSIFEAFGLSFLEAMGHGLACIGPDSFGPKDYIKDNQTGFGVPIKDAQHIALCLKKLLESEPLRRQLGHNAYQVVRKEYTWEAVVARMIPHLEEVAKSLC
jgi:starch synthase